MFISKNNIDVVFPVPGPPVIIKFFKHPSSTTLACPLESSILISLSFWQSKYGVPLKLCLKSLSIVSLIPFLAILYFFKYK